MKKEMALCLGLLLGGWASSRAAALASSDRSPAFDDRACCQALAYRNQIFCFQAGSPDALHDCAALLTVSPSHPRDTRQCRSQDCVAMVNDDAAGCRSDDCRAIVTGDPSICTSVTCQAALSRDATRCD